MKAIIHIEKKSLHNSKFEALTSNLLRLEICGKSLFSYYFEFLNELEVEDIYLLGEDLELYVDDYYKSEVFSSKLYFNSNNIDDFIKENKKYIQNDELIIIDGIGFIFNSFNDLKNKISTVNKNFIVQDKSFVLKYIKDINQPNFLVSNSILIKEITDIKDYIFVLDNVLKKLNKLDYTVGYSNQDGVVLGKNVNIDKFAKIISPIVIMDNVKISKNCIIGPNVIVSNDVFIEENTIIQNSLIDKNTYVGKDLELVNKIITKNKIIDKTTFNEYIIDEKLLSDNK